MAALPPLARGGRLSLRNSYSFLKLQTKTIFNDVVTENDDVILDDDENDDDDDSPLLGMYVHIPYCRRRCNYCDFAIVPVGDINTADNNQISNEGFAKMNYEYTNAIINEIEMIHQTSSTSSTHKQKQQKQKKKQRLQSIYFGGGTPSLAPIDTLRHILSAIRNVFSIDNTNTIEITIEMDPGTFTFQYLQSIKEIGFNRISLGVQSFDDTLLTTLGRVHCVKDIYDSVHLINTVFGSSGGSSSRPNYSIDLISGIPGLTLAKWTETLYNAIHTLHPSPTHVSLYDLQIEDGTVFSRWYKEKNNDKKDMDKGGGGEENRHRRSRNVLALSTTPSLPSSNDSAFMYSYASGYLRHLGYEHYEISSYALLSSPSTSSSLSSSIQLEKFKQQSSYYRSKHNQIYWDYNGQWHAVGLGATSNVNGKSNSRYVRPRAVSDYITWTEEIQRKYDDAMKAKTLFHPPWLQQELHDNKEELEVDDNNNMIDNNDTDDDMLLDIIMTRLRTIDGLDLDWINTQDEYNERHVHAILHGFELAMELDLGQRYNNNSPCFMIDDTDDDDTDNGMKTTTMTSLSYGHIRLNDPKGFLFSNYVISNIFMKLSELN
jgi:oxygen-independent coproporphyrinogen-3 oxidase